MRRVGGFPIRVSMLRRCTITLGTKQSHADLRSEGLFRAPRTIAAVAAQPLPCHDDPSRHSRTCVYVRRHSLGGPGRDLLRKLLWLATSLYNINITSTSGHVYRYWKSFDMVVKLSPRPCVLAVQPLHIYDTCTQRWTSLLAFYNL